MGSRVIYAVLFVCLLPAVVVVVAYVVKAFLEVISQKRGDNDDDGGENQSI